MEESSIISWRVPRTIAVRRHVFVAYLFLRSIDTGVMMKLSIPQCSSVLVGDVIVHLFNLCLCWSRPGRSDFWVNEYKRLNDYGHIAFSGYHDISVPLRKVRFPLKPSCGRFHSSSDPILSMPCIYKSLRAYESETKTPFLRIIRASRKSKQSSLHHQQPRNSLLRTCEMHIQRLCG